MSRALPVIDMLGPSSVAAPRRTPPPGDERLAEFLIEDVVMPRFHVWTLGCQMNHSDSEEMAGSLLAAGCSEASSLEAADLIVINSCAIREAAEQKVIGRMGVLGRLRQANPAVRVVLTGCSVRVDNASALKRRYPAVDLFLRPDEEPELAARLGLAGPTAPGVAASYQRVARSVAATADRLPKARAAAVAQGRVARGSGRAGAAAVAMAWLPIIYGCDKTCTYCIVPFSRGPERSRPFDEVLEEARSLAAGGYQEVTLLGQNVNSYGHDLPPEARFSGVRGERSLGRSLALDGRPDIAALLRAIDGIRTSDGVAAIPRLRFVTSHPWDLTDRLIAAMRECSSVCEHLHLPIQAGDDAVLHRMGRQYRVDEYLDLVERLRGAIPGIALTTDVIVGFCGETQAQSEATLELLRSVRYDQVFAAAFSVRAGTPASRLPDDVPAQEKKRRLNRLLEVQEAIGLEINRSWEGRDTEVLVEGVRASGSHAALDQAGIDSGTSTRLSGRNREHKLVHFSGDPSLIGSRVTVTVERGGPYALVGRLAS